MDYQSRIEFQSKVYPGVAFILNRMSHGRRIQLNQKAAGVFTRISELSSSLEPINDEITRAEAAARILPCTCDHLPEVHDAESLRCSMKGCNCRKAEPDAEIGDYASRNKVQGEIFKEIADSLYPAYIRWAVAEIKGLTIDGQPATVESLLDSGDERLVAELGAEIQRMIRIGPDETLGFKQPTTSGAQVEGQMSMDQSTALPASGESTTNPATVSATSPS